jgi:hypothetical protein
MSANLPSQRLPSIEWLESHIANWNTNAAGIGLSPASVTALATDIANARQAFTDTQQIRAESKAKTTDFYAKTKAMHDNAAVMIQTIKAFADAAPIPATVYTLAQVSPPDPASPLAPPTQPINLSYRVQPNGSIKLAWDATGPSGTIYNVTRQLPGETAFTFVGQGDSSDKSFTDAALPAGSASASYRVQGVHGSLIGPESLTFTVFFGTAGAGGAMNAAA